MLFRSPVSQRDTTASATPGIPCCRIWATRWFQPAAVPMRAAVLAFAFDCLGAEGATSGAIQGNPASLGVSRKLGYEVVGAHSVSPRGVSVDHADLELLRDRFTAPVPVEISGLGGLPPLFGASA